jgi:two-component system, NarL family, response regulator DevR
MNIELEVVSSPRVNGSTPGAAPRWAKSSVPAGGTLTPIRCLLVDDHPAVRVGLRELLAAEPGFEVLDALATAEAAVAFAERTRVDVAIVDYQLGGRSGLWVSRKLKRLPHPPAVLIYSAFSDYLLAAACVVAQADGLVSKAALGSDLCDRIREAARGVTRLPLVPPALADSMRRRLDPEEQSIFGLLQAGIATEEIARTLNLGHGELEARLWTMLRKLERLDPVN